MYKYYVYNITRRSYCIITSDHIMEEGQTVLVKFDNAEFEDDGLNECRIIQVMKNLLN